MAQIILENPSLGGLSDSKYLGNNSSLASIVGLDIHSEPGIIKVNQKMTKESGSTVDSLVNAMVACSDGSTYLFGNNGKIWKRTSGGTYSLERTASPAAGSAAILDAKEYQGYIYYAMQSRLGRWQVGTAWSGAADNYATFTRTDANYHPMCEVNQILFIGDKNYIAQVDAGTFTANALDLKDPLRVQSLAPDGIELLIGAFTGANVNDTQAIRWNTWSPSYSWSDQLPEVGITAFLPTDNSIMAIGGNKGNIYQYNGSSMVPLKRIPGDWSNSANRAMVNVNSVADKLGIALFGLTNVNGNPASQGIYSLGRYSQNFPMVLSQEHVISTGATTGLTLGAMCYIPGSGSTADTLLLSWFDGTDYGVDALDSTTKSTTAYLDSRIITVDRAVLKRVAQIDACYRTLPTGTSFRFYVSKNHGAFEEITDVVVDSDRQIVSTTVSANDCATFQVRVAFVTNANAAPELEKTIITI